MTKFAIAALFGIAGLWVLLFVLEFPFRGDFEWDGPTRDAHASRKEGVLVSSFEASPTSVDLGDTTYEIREVWAEHHFEIRWANWFQLKKRISPEIRICVCVAPTKRNPMLARTAIRVKDGKSREVYGFGYGDLEWLHFDVGMNLPREFVLRCDTRDREATIALTEVSNHLLDLTSPSVTPPASAGGAPSVAADH